MRTQMAHIGYLWRCDAHQWPRQMPRLWHLTRLWYHRHHPQLVRVVEFVWTLAMCSQLRHLITLAEADSYQFSARSLETWLSTRDSCVIPRSGSSHDSVA